MRIAFSDVSSVNDFAWLRSGLSLVDNRSAAYVKEHKYYEGRRDSLAVRLLLRKLLDDIFPVIERDENKRPFSRDISGDFSWAHSDGLCVCVYSEKRVGIDVEIKRDEEDLSFVKEYLSEEEKGSELSRAFLLEALVRRESILKADGRGLTLPIEEIRALGQSTLLNEIEWTVRGVDICSDGLCFVACEEEVE